MMLAAAIVVCLKLHLPCILFSAYGSQEDIFIGTYLCEDWRSIQTSNWDYVFVNISFSIVFDDWQRLQFVHCTFFIDLYTVLVMNTKAAIAAAVAVISGSLFYTLNLRPYLRSRKMHKVEEEVTKYLKPKELEKEKQNAEFK